MNKFISKITLLIAVLALTTNLSSQEFRLGDKVIVGGTGIQEYDNGGPAGAGYWALFATVGQGVAGELQLGSDDHFLGFWGPTFWELTSVEEVSDADKIELSNYPNPFQSTTQIKFNLESSSDVTIKIYDVNGNLVQTLFKGIMAEGPQEIQWNGKYQSGMDAESGSYLYEVTVEPFGGSISASKLQARNIMVLVK
jgi:hypothetical protein